MVQVFLILRFQLSYINEIKNGGRMPVLQKRPHIVIESQCKEIKLKNYNSVPVFRK